MNRTMELNEVEEGVREAESAAKVRIIIEFSIQSSLFSFKA